MTIVQINSVTTGSTGKIMMMLHKTAKKNGFASYCFYGRGSFENDGEVVKIADNISIYFHVLMSRLFDAHCFGSVSASERLIGELEKIKPDVVHIHNIHGYYLNFKMIVEYLKAKDIPIVWTLHDCWLFTGHCAYYDRAGCSKWQTICRSCGEKKAYPKAYISRAKTNFKIKKQLLSSLENVVYVSPSVWLKNEFKKSFLKDKRIEVINNGIDLDIFKPADYSEMKNRLGLTSEFIILSVASDFSDARKGFTDLMKVAELLPESCVLVLVGMGKNQNMELPKNVIGIKRTENINELVSLYSMADVFINTTYEDNYPTVNLEALACGTPCITYNTGGCSEQVSKESGFIVEKGDFQAVLEKIKEIKNEKRDYSNDCIKAAHSIADMHDKYGEYIMLYKRIIKDGGDRA